ncbi:MAG: peptide-methionine (S)-S-oxide reductase [Myxococcales bacterium]|nr:MAG: peptide-methionine (S)-S-oxide reductase [Myxococcales bacterium]
MRLATLAVPLLIAILPGCSSPEPRAPHAVAHGVGTRPGQVGRGTPLQAAPGHELASFAAGCFWGVEARFREVPGVVATAVGYTGGHTPDPTYAAVCTHTTGHAEAVLIEFDPARVSYESLLQVFWSGHDPTQLDRQGPDMGDQYRSAIFTLSPAQDTAARASLAAAQKRLKQPIVTRVAPLAPFHLAEDYHQQYHEKTGSEACPTGKPELNDTI